MTATPGSAPARQVGAGVAGMSDAQLADAHRGHMMAKLRAVDELKAIEAELEGRGLTRVVSPKSIVERHANARVLVDADKLRALELQLLMLDPAIAGSVSQLVEATSVFHWRSRTNRDAATT